MRHHTYRPSKAGRRAGLPAAARVVVSGEHHHLLVERDHRLEYHGARPTPGAHQPDGLWVGAGLYDMAGVSLGAALSPAQVALARSIGVSA